MFIHFIPLYFILGMTFMMNGTIVEFKDFSFAKLSFFDPSTYEVATGK